MNRAHPALLPSVLVTLLALAASAPASGQLAVVATVPARHSGTALPGATISITFDRPLAVGSVSAGSVRAFGRSSGPVAAAFSFSNANATLTLTPSRPFKNGEVVTVNLANSLAAADGSQLRSAGYAFQFLTVAGAAQGVFDEIDTMSVRTTAAGTRLYGGAAIDLDLDGWTDLATANEDSGDLRILMNRADGSGLYDLLTPPTPIDLGPSPNEAADYDNDGLPDLATANYLPSTVSIVLGNGDGSFAAQQSVSVGATPHGLAALDFDGDGDWDLVTANEGASNLSRLANDGNGVFTALTSFEGGGSGEYPVATGDMNNDGILDLVVGTRNDQQVHVLTGNGDGTFSHVSNRSAGGLTWMIVLGDLNGDGNLDVTSANGQSANGSVLLGNGDATLQPAVVYTFSGHMVATDLGDLDGDGDLDWVTSSFGGGRWHVLRNDGTGSFTQVDQIFASSNASCAVLYDFDNDGDLDMALFDEIADEVKLLRNRGGTSIFADGFETGDTMRWSLTVP